MAKKTNEQRSNAAHSVVLVHNQRLGIDTDEMPIESQIAELAKGLRILAEEYGLDFDDISKQ